MSKEIITMNRGFRSLPAWLLLAALCAGGAAAQTTVHTMSSKVAYSYLDISQSGTQVLAGEDDATAIVNSGFPFKFYGQTYTSLCVSTNGLIAFGGCNDDFANLDLTSQAPPPAQNLPLIAPFWDDLTFGVTGAGSVVYQVLGTAPNRQLVIQWQNVFGAGTESPLNFQVVLRETTNTILFQYKNVAPGVGSLDKGIGATVGIRGVDGQTNGHRSQFSYNAPTLKDSMAILFAPKASELVGVYRGGQWIMDVNGDGTLGPEDRDFFLGFAGATQITGDWNGDGRTKAGVYKDGFWFLDYDGDGVWDGGVVDKLIGWGWPGATPMVGDWNGDGKTEIGVYSGGFWFLDYNGDYLWDGGVVDKQVGWGWAGTMPIVGDWNGDGKTKIGVYIDGFWFLDYDGNYSWDGGVVDKQVGWGWAGVTPIVGDWNGDGKTKIGVYAGGFWYLDYDGNYLWEYPASDKIWQLGWTGTTPVIGDWNGDGKDKAGTFVNGYWYLDYNGNGAWDGSGTDVVWAFGQTGDTPVIGRW